MTQPPTPTEFTATLIIPAKNGHEVEREVPVRARKVAQRVEVLMPDGSTATFTRRTATARTGLLYMAQTRPGDLHPRLRLPS